MKSLHIQARMGGCKRKATALALASVALGVLMVPCAAFSFSSLVPKFTSYPWSFVHPCPLRWGLCSDVLECSVQCTTAVVFLVCV
jgi:hypothetical protein